eukprot:TRINITY_DN56070_c0_g1_i1.p1 TRINITY_DN56070_c0_g1~~TRINITY_DN56070_c0_g1_i1.p1  ORF type:complete len:305 (-),score=20.53 TRINITY_DN56070_c0_g1_i1:325-1239(-)
MAWTRQCGFGRVVSTSLSWKLCWKMVKPRHAFSVSTPGAVNIERYPLHDLERCASLVAQSRDEVAKRGYCHLPGFLRPEAIKHLTEECNSLVSAGRFFRSHETHNVYLQESEGAQGDHDSILSKQFPSSKMLVSMDELSEDSTLLEIYHWDALRNFLQKSFGLRELYRSADPIGGVYYNVFDAACNDALGWHFDRSRYSINLILQTTPGAGGDFQFVADTRPQIEKMRLWSEVEEHIQGRLQTPELLPGSLYLFAGNRSIHQVSAVTHGKRVNAIFTYVDKPDEKLNEYTRLKFFGRSGPRARM